MAKNPNISGIGGWLSLLIFLLMILGPLGGMGKLSNEFSNAVEQFPLLLSNAQWQNYTQLSWLIFTVLASMQFVAGYRLLKIHTPQSVNFAIIVIWVAGPIGNALYIISAIVIFGNNDNSNAFAQQAGALTASLIAAAIWTAYLLRSVRVINTYKLIRPNVPIAILSSEVMNHDKPITQEQLGVKVELSADAETAKTASSPADGEDKTVIGCPHKLDVVCSFLITSKFKRLVISSTLAALILIIVSGIDILRVRGDWLDSQAIYAAWISGSEKQYCEELVKDLTRQFEDLKCENSGPPEKIHEYRCDDPNKEAQRFKINLELKKSGCPLDGIDEYLRGIYSLRPPVHPKSYLDFFSKNTQLKLSMIFLGFPIVASILFFLLSLVRSLILIEKHAGWFRLTILLSCISAIFIPLFLYIEGIETNVFPELGIYSIFSLVGMAALIVYGRLVSKWIYSGFKNPTENTPARKSELGP